MVAPPTLYWWQLDAGTYGPAYYGQLDTCIRELCTLYGVAPPKAVWWNGAASGTLADGWILEIDRCARELCVILNVEPPITLPSNFFSGVGPRQTT